MSTFLGLGHSLDYQKSGLQIKYGQTLLGGFILQIRFILYDQYDGVLLY